MFEQFLQAREARQALIDRACEAGGTVVFASTGVPGAEKSPDGLAPVFSAACERLASSLDAVPVARGIDALGSWALFTTRLAAGDAKRVCVRIEEEQRAGRLLDLDVYHNDRQVDRASLGLPPRRCLACERPAVECIRLKRHTADGLSRAVSGLLAVPAPHDRASERLASALVVGARVELALTPKPGLVDREDNGSHPDLSFDAMARSVDLLPAYFEELLTLGTGLKPVGTGLKPRATGDTDQARGTGLKPRATGDTDDARGTGLKPRATGVPGDTGDEALAACIDAGRRAERRMTDAIGANAHRGYIFLGGLTLLASFGGEEHIREGIRDIARAVADARPGIGDGPISHGSAIRRQLGLGGIEQEALAGLPSVFERALPALRARRSAHQNRRGADRDEPLHYAMAVLMQVVEDTTAVHRCGRGGLERLRADGRALQVSIESERAYLPWLRALNGTYRTLNLTMGGVADCLALTVALDRWLAN